MPDRRTFLTSTLVAGGLLQPLLALSGQATSNPGKPLLVKPTLENSYWYIGHLMSVLYHSSDTDGLFSLVRMTEVKGLEPPPHTHTREDETFIVLEGQMEFTVDGKKYVAGAGDSMFLPRNVQHSFSMITERAEVLILLSPGGFEKFFIEMSVPAPELSPAPLPDGPPDIPKLIKASERYGVHFPRR